MDITIGILRVYIKNGVIAETTLTPLFEYFFKSFPDLSKEEKIDIFMDITKMRRPDDYPNTWIDLDFPVDEKGGPLLPSKPKIALSVTLALGGSIQLSK